VARQMSPVRLLLLLPGSGIGKGGWDGSLVLALCRALWHCFNAILSKGGWDAY